jgi:dTDP-4-amino-4,6-dideoxygalactose transaminase
MMRVPFLNVAALSAEVRDESIAALTRVYDSGAYILGEEVAAFEAECTPWFGETFHCVGVSNGTDALVCALLAAGVEPGQRVLTTPLTFFATASAICRVGAIPVFADVDEQSYHMLPCGVPERDIAAIVPVHLFGRMVNIAEWRAAYPDVPIVEDAAQAWGAVLDGNRAGAVGDVGCFSFFPAKPLGACGDAGMVVTRDATLAERCRALLAHGRTRDGEFSMLGGNYRLDALQAALLRVRLRQVTSWLARRQRNAERYLEALKGIPGLMLPLADSEHDRSAWSVFSVRVTEGREALREFLAERGVETAVYYPKPVHLQPALSGLVQPGALPRVERLCRELLALPVGPELHVEQLEYVCSCIHEFFGRRLASSDVAPMRIPH